MRGRRLLEGGTYFSVDTQWCGGQRKYGTLSSYIYISKLFIFYYVLISCLSKCIDLTVQRECIFGIMFLYLMNQILICLCSKIFYCLVKLYVFLSKKFKFLVYFSLKMFFSLDTFFFQQVIYQFYPATLPYRYLQNVVSIKLPKQLVILSQTCSKFQFSCILKFVHKSVCFCETFRTV